MNFMDKSKVVVACCNCEKNSFLLSLFLFNLAIYKEMVIKGKVYSSAFDEGRLSLSHTHRVVLKPSFSTRGLGVMLLCSQ